MKFVAFYADEKTNNRHFSLTGNSIVSYIYDKLIENNVNCEIVSPSWYQCKHKFTKSYVGKDSCERSVRYAPSFCRNCDNKLEYVMRVVLAWLWLIMYLIHNCENGETLLVYHTTNLMLPLILVKKIKRLKFIAYFGEMYQDVYDMPNYEKKIEQYFINLCDDYLFANRNLKERVQNWSECSKEYVELLGPYRKQQIFEINRDDRITKIVYAGKINTDKGVMNVIRAAEYLDDNYEIHILGYGTNQCLDNMKKAIEEVSRNSNACKVVYDGILMGEDYNRFLQECNVGICVQNTEAAFNMYSFPSKILSYLGNGLSVLCVSMSAVSESPLRDILYFCKTNEPSEIAKEIKANSFVKKTDENLSIIEKLDFDFVRGLIHLVRKNEFENN